MTKPNNINSLEEILDKLLNAWTMKDEQSKGIGKLTYGEAIKELKALLTSHEQQARREGVIKFARYLADNKYFPDETKIVEALYDPDWMEDGAKQFLEENPSA